MVVVNRNPAPVRSVEQQVEALGKANLVRTQRSQLKMQVNGGSIKVADLLRDPPQYIHSMKVFDLLMAVRGVGKVKVDKILRKHTISPSKTVDGLSPRQRAELIRETYNW